MSAAPNPVASPPHTAMPPPPPPLNPRPDRSQSLVLLGVFVLALVALVAAHTGQVPEADLFERAGAFYALYSALVAASWLPPGALTRRLDALLDRWIGSDTGGYYGLMALATFCELELAAILDQIGNAAAGDFNLREHLVAWLTGFSIDSVMNMIDAFIWPAGLLRSTEPLHVGMFVAATWMVYAAGGRLLPVIAPEAAGARRRRA